jgi:exo-1,4-beta-D-glucosaminidase
MLYDGGSQVGRLWRLSRRRFLGALAGNGIASAVLFPSTKRRNAASLNLSNVVPMRGFQDSRLSIGDGWRVQSSASVRTSGEVVSTERFDTTGWYPISVPSTVLTVLVENKVYPDPYFGMNLRSIPGTTYPIGDDFANIPMPPDSPFGVSWWYRREFEIPVHYEGKTIWLNFRGINYRANIWVNGRQIADTTQVVGAYRFYEFDITAIAKPGRTNVLALEVFAPHADDLGINWVDVNPGPPDKNMGLWGEAFLAASGPLAIRHPQVISDVNLTSLAEAKLTVYADLYNSSQQAIRGTVRGELEDIAFEQDVEVGPRGRKRVKFVPERFPQLNISHPRLWWPWQLGEQNLHTMKIQVKVNGDISDTQQVRFGIRKVTSEFTAEGHRLFRINGQKILIRGALWWSDMLLRRSPERQEIELHYVKDMHLNCLRMDGKFEDDHFLDLADQFGILLAPGWCCCDHWERWQDWKEEDYAVAVDCLRDRIRWFRNHPSVMSWANGDDNSPPQKVAEMYVNVLKEANWPNPILGSINGAPAAVTGPTGLKETGPYDYVPPSYWLTDKTHGGAFGFIFECSPGPDIPTIESLRSFIPEDHLWPVNDYWNFHAGGGVFKDIHVFVEALNQRLGQAGHLDDFVRKAELMAYDGVRAMYEAYGRNKYTSTGVIHECLNSGWPSLIWHLYDYYLRPAGSYFGTKKGCEPLHVQYSYDDRSVVVVNSYYRGFKGLKVSAAVYDFDLREKFSRQVAVDLAPDSSTRVLTIPGIQGLTTTYFVRLSLEDSEAKVVSRNFYWLSTKPDVLDWEKTTWYYTPTKSFADLTPLHTLPQVGLKGSSTTRGRGNENVTQVSLENPTNKLAFFVRLRVTKGHPGEDVVPILWEDNYFELMPGERREVQAIYRRKDLQGHSPAVEADGWNVQRTLLA